MAERPDFSPELSREQFQSYYWYKAELETICRRYHLPSYGTKSELTDYLGRFLDGQSPEDIKAVRQPPTSKTSLRADQITLGTKLLGSGFRLNNQARQFFATYFGLEKFSFKKAMAVKMRDVQASHDREATVADLIAVLENPTSLSSGQPEEKTYQWNQFVRDFRRDPKSKKYQSPLTVAAILWRLVRDSQCEKVYTPQLLLENEFRLVPYLKSKKSN
ncbi:SAP domain-containing protein [Streptococcus dentasini]